MDNTIGIAQLATLLTAAGVAIYVLGLVGLALSINLTFTEKWSTAWYAVSLMPRTVVAGQGVRIWRRGVVRIVILIVLGNILGTVIVQVGRTVKQAVDQYLAHVFLYPFGEPIAATGIVAVISMVVALVFVVAVARTMGRLYQRKVDDNAPQHRHLSLVTAASFWIIGGGMSLAGAYLASMGLPLNSDDPVKWDNITVGFLIILVALFFIAIPAADRIEHPLPRVTLINAGEATPNTVGWLVAHSDGYWHLFDSQHVLLSIPDERVVEARVDDPGISEQLDASSKSIEQLRQAPPEKSGKEGRDD